MGATSATGTGLGMSNGEYKPENHAGCGPPPKDPEPVEPKKPRGCVTKHVSGGTIRHKSGGSNNIKVCS